MGLISCSPSVGWLRRYPFRGLSSTDSPPSFISFEDRTDEASHTSFTRQVTLRSDTLLGFTDDLIDGFEVCLEERSILLELLIDVEVLTA